MLLQCWCDSLSPAENDRALYYWVTLSPLCTRVCMTVDPLAHVCGNQRTTQVTFFRRDPPHFLETWSFTRLELSKLADLGRSSLPTSINQSRSSLTGTPRGAIHPDLKSSRGTLFLLLGCLIQPCAGICLVFL